MVTITSFSSIHEVTTRPALNKKKPPYMFEINKIMFRPNLDKSRGVFGLPGKTKLKVYIKLTVVMCCQIFARRSAVPYGGDFCQRPLPR